MRVRLSPLARAYVVAEARYLRQRHQGAASDFLERMKTAQKTLAMFALAGFENTSLPVPGMRRLLTGGYCLDYRVIDGVVEVAAIKSSVNTPLEFPGDDDFDYEADPDTGA